MSRPLPRQAATLKTSIAPVSTLVTKPILTSDRNRFSSRPDSSNSPEETTKRSACLAVVEIRSKETTPLRTIEESNINPFGG